MYIKWGEPTVSSYVAGKGKLSKMACCFLDCCDSGVSSQCLLACCDALRPVIHNLHSPH